MKRIAILSAALLAGASLARASMGELTKRYAFSNVRMGYMDHFHHEDKSRDLNFSFAGLAFSRQVQMDPFVMISDGVKEAGFSFPIYVSQKFYLLPAVFRNFDAEQYGMAINITVVLR